MIRIMQGMGLAALILVAGACNPTPPKRELDSKEAWQEPGTGAPLAKEAFGVGDIEAALRLETTIAEKSKAENVKEERMIDMRQHLVMSTAAVAPPAPKELWASFKLTASPPPEGSAVVRVKVLRDDAEIGSFSTVIVAGPNKPVEESFDILAGLATPPQTMLVRAQAELVLIPAGTDPATVDPKTFSGAADTTGTLLGNPLRIDFAAAS